MLKSITVQNFVEIIVRSLDLNLQLRILENLLYLVCT